MAAKVSFDMSINTSFVCTLLCLYHLSTVIIVITYRHYPHHHSHQLFKGQRTFWNGKRSSIWGTKHRWGIFKLPFWVVLFSFTTSVYLPFAVTPSCYMNYKLATIYDQESTWVGGCQRKLLTVRGCLAPLPVSVTTPFANTTSTSVSSWCSFVINLIFTNIQFFFHEASIWTE